MENSVTLHSAKPIYQTKPKIVYMSTIKRMKNQNANFFKGCCVPMDVNCHFSWIYFSQFSYSPPKSIKVKSMNLLFHPNWIIEVKDHLSNTQNLKINKQVGNTIYLKDRDCLVDHDVQLIIGIFLRHDAYERTGWINGCIPGFVLLIILIKIFLTCW
jgi:hypothetical protein